MWRTKNYSCEIVRKSASQERSPCPRKKVLEDPQSGGMTSAGKKMRPRIMSNIGGKMCQELMIDISIMFYMYQYHTTVKISTLVYGINILFLLLKSNQFTTTRNTNIQTALCILAANNHDRNYFSPFLSDERTNESTHIHKRPRPPCEERTIASRNPNRRDGNHSSNWIPQPGRCTRA